MVSEDRQRVIETNRSLRLIKNELESLLEKGIIADDIFDQIHTLLPAESPLYGGPSPGSGSASRAAAAAAPLSPPPSSVASDGGYGYNPPAYAQTGPPSLPQRNQPPPPPPPSKPVLSHATALYAYAASDARDLSFQRGDRLAVLEYMNDDWWMGRNTRTGEEGIFPKTYVEISAASPPPTALPSQPGWPDDVKSSPMPWQQQPPQQQQYGSYPPPPPPGQGDPYNAAAPPMAIAEQGGGNAGGGHGFGHGKGAELGKKFGRKLGNAAIFGAGATLGGDLVNSIL